MTVMNLENLVLRGVSVVSEAKRMGAPLATVQTSAVLSLMFDPSPSYPMAGQRSGLCFPADGEQSRQRTGRSGSLRQGLSTSRSLASSARGSVLSGHTPRAAQVRLAAASGAGLCGCEDTSAGAVAAAFRDARRTWPQQGGNRPIRLAPCGPRAGLFTASLRGERKR